MVPFLGTAVTEPDKRFNKFDFEIPSTALRLLGERVGSVERELLGYGQQADGNYSIRTGLTFLDLSRKSIDQLEVVSHKLALKSEGENPLKVGDKFLLVSGQQDIMVNRWDQYIAVRNGAVEAVWDIPGRGCHN